MADHASVSVPPIPAHLHLSPEFSLLVACSWLGPTPALTAAQAQRIAALCQEGIDWRAFAALVERHRVHALAYVALQRHADDRVPGEVMETLRELSDACRKEALGATAELLRLARRFTGQGIPILPLKGQLLSERLFGEPTLRHTHDIDLMVRSGDLGRATQLLAAEGYRSAASHLSGRKKNFLLSTFHHLGYWHPDKRVPLELHWSNALWTPGQVDLLWQHAHPVRRSGAEMNALEDDVLLFYLCAHGAHHKWSRLKWLSDAAVLFGHDRPAGWARLLALAGQFDMRRPLAQAALLTHWLYGLPIPAPLAQLIKQEKRTASLAARALVACLKAKALDWSDYIYLMHLRRNPPYRLFLKNLLIGSADMAKYPLPDRLFWLYCPLRPFIWLWRHCSLGKGM